MQDELEIHLQTLQAIIARCEWTLKTPQYQNEPSSDLAESVIRIATRNDGK